MAGKSLIKASGENHVTLDTAVAQKVLQRLQGNNNAYVTVGVHADAGTYEDLTEGNKKPVPVAKVAYWLEYGTKFMEKRPFLYATMRAKERVLASLLSQAEAMVTAGKTTVVQGLARVGFEAQTFVQNAIKSNVPPPLSAKYLRRRRLQFPEAGSRTLLRTGLLLRSIRYKIFVGGKEVAAPDAGQASGAHGGGPEARARGRTDMRRDRNARRQQQAAARKDPKAARARFDAQRRVRTEMKPPDRDG